MQVFQRQHTIAGIQASIHMSTTIDTKESSSSNDVVDFKVHTNLIQMPRCGLSYSTCGFTLLRCGNHKDKPDNDNYSNNR